jgi:hypothetical protein
MTDERFHYVASTEGRHELYEYRQPGPLKNVAHHYPNEATYYKNLADAFYHTGLYLRFHNSHSLKEKFPKPLHSP